MNPNPTPFVQRQGNALIIAIVIAAVISIAITLLAVGIGLFQPANHNTLTAPTAESEARRSTRFERPDEMDLLTIPPFEMRTQDGELVDQTIFDGRLTILDFLFTNCPLICPQLSGELTGLQEELSDTPVRIVSISVDPERDTPERLKSYASGFADFDRWTFLTGDEDTVRRIAVDGLALGLAVEEGADIELAGGETMQNIIHPTKFILVGPDRKILRLYSGLRDEDVDRLARDVRLLVRELGPFRD